MTRLKWCSGADWPYRSSHAPLKFAAVCSAALDPGGTPTEYFLLRSGQWFSHALRLSNRLWSAVTAVGPAPPGANGYR